MRVSKTVFLSTSVIALAASAPSMAQEAAQGAGVADIIVTAQRREQSLQDVPIAITALDQSILSGNRITTAGDLDAIAPNLTVRPIPGGVGIPNYTMRGANAIATQPGADRGIALYVDGVYVGNAVGSVFEIGDIERIEVLRGPQGTLFGRNSTGGAISVITPEPTGELGIRHSFTVGNYDQFRSVTKINLPSFGPLSISGNYFHSQRDGDMRNLGAGNVIDYTRVGLGKYTSPKYLGSSNTDAVAAAAKLDLGALQTVYRFNYSETVQSQPGQGIRYVNSALAPLFNDPFNPNQMTPITDKRPKAVNNWITLPATIKTQSHTLTTSYEISDEFSAKNISAYRKSTYIGNSVQLDGAGGLINTQTPAGAGLPSPAQVLFGLGAVRNPNGTINVGASNRFPLAPQAAGQPVVLFPTVSNGDFKQWSSELQFFYNSDFLTATVGGLYYRSKQRELNPGVDGNPLGDVQSSSFVVLPGFQIPNLAYPKSYGAINTAVKVESIAGYGQFEFHLTDQLDVILGGRLTRDKKTGVDNMAVSAATPNLTFPVYYKKSKFTYNIGANYKLNNDILIYGKYVTGFISGGQIATLAYRPEEAKSFEAGIKADLFDRRLRFNLVGFHVDYKDVQQTTTGSNLTPPRPELTQVLINMGDATAKGFELETTFVPVRSLVLSGAVGYTDFKVKNVDPVVSTGAYAVYASDRPAWTANVAAQYTMDFPVGDGQLMARIDGNYRSQRYGFTSVPGAGSGFTPAQSETYIKTNTSEGYWIFNARLAAQKLEFFGGVKSEIALWGRNIFNNKSVTYGLSLGPLLSPVAYERAPTFGADWTIEL